MEPLKDLLSRAEALGPNGNDSELAASIRLAASQEYGTENRSAELMRILDLAASIEKRKKGTEAEVLATGNFPSDNVFADSFALGSYAGSIVRTYGLLDTGVTEEVLGLAFAVLPREETGVFSQPRMYWEIETNGREENRTVRDGRKRRMETFGLALREQIGNPRHMALFTHVKRFPDSPNALFPPRDLPQDSIYAAQVEETYICADSFLPRRLEQTMNDFPLFFGAHVAALVGNPQYKKRLR